MKNREIIFYQGQPVVCKSTNELKPSTNGLDSPERILAISAVAVVVDNIETGECIVQARCLATGVRATFWCGVHLSCITHYQLKKIRKELNARIAEKVLKEYREKQGLEEYDLND